MFVYRCFRNTDPPALTTVWNESATARGAFTIRSPAVLDRWVLSKPYFEPAALTVAELAETREVVGFSLAGFGPNESLSDLNHACGVVAAVLVRPAWRRQGVGRELLQHAEEFLRRRGAVRIVVGSQRPNNPYLFGIYGGSNSPGILDSDAEARPFLSALHFRPATHVAVYQRRLDEPINLADPRLVFLRKRYDVQIMKAAVVETWWGECLLSALDPAEFRVIDKLTNIPAARATAWELEGFGWKWKFPAAGIIDLQVRPDLRRQGLAKMLLTAILRTLQDQFFGIAELQVSANDPAATNLCKSLGFEQVDTGCVYEREPAPAPGTASVSEMA